MARTILPSRRALLIASTGLVLAPGAALAATDRFANSSWRKLSDAEWKRRLPELSYQVLRHDETERTYSSPLLNEHRRGTFACLGCGLALFKSEWKYDSHTGWPSFWTVMRANIGEKPDHELVLEPRTEYHCLQCLGHQGHVFNDGPKPTGLRYCNDGAALKFIPA